MTNPHLTDPTRADEIARLTEALRAIVQDSIDRGWPMPASAKVEGTGGNCLGLTVNLSNGVEITIADSEQFGQTGYDAGAVMAADGSPIAADAPDSTHLPTLRALVSYVQSVAALDMRPLWTVVQETVGWCVVDSTGWRAPFSSGSLETAISYAAGIELGEVDASR